MKLLFCRHVKNTKKSRRSLFLIITSLNTACRNSNLNLPVSEVFHQSCSCPLPGNRKRKRGAEDGGFIRNGRRLETSLSFPAVEPRKSHAFFAKNVTTYGRMSRPKHACITHNHPVMIPMSRCDILCTFCMKLNTR